VKLRGFFDLMRFELRTFSHVSWSMFATLPVLKITKRPSRLGPIFDSSVFLSEIIGQKHKSMQIPHLCRVLLPLSQEN
jgi:hypothetical protein